VVNSLLHHATHKNTAYRSKVALLADHLVERHGSAVSDRCAVLVTWAVLGSRAACNSQATITLACNHASQRSDITSHLQGS
jgi:hypothetical protein